MWCHSSRSARGLRPSLNKEGSLFSPVNKCICALTDYNPFIRFRSSCKYYWSSSKITFNPFTLLSVTYFFLLILFHFFSRGRLPALRRHSFCWSVDLRLRFCAAELLTLDRCLHKVLLTLLESRSCESTESVEGAMVCSTLHWACVQKACVQ